MTKDELIARLGKYEWSDVEFKLAQRGVPADAYKTVSAFSNTAGGYLVFGVKDTQGNLEIVGVIEVDRVQNDFLSVLRSQSKLNRVIDVQEDAIDHEGRTLLIFYIPEAQRKEKPVYLIGDIRRSYIRRGGGDEQCTQAEIERFLRDSADTTYDGELLAQFDAEEFFDPPSVAWYRRILQGKQGDRHAGLSDLEFLNEWGFVVEAGDQLVPTRAAVLLFGKGRYIRQILPRGLVDYQRIDTAFNDWSPEKRWHDRVVVEENIIQAWQVLVEKYMRLAERPFSVDTATLRRHDDPPDYISFREAAINLLIHQDYGDHTRKPVIKIFVDRTVFWNPGDSFATVDQLLEPTEKEVRNPAIVNAFRRIGLSDQAGTGVRSIVGNWGQLGYVPPIIDNNKTEKTFELVLRKELLLTEQQRLFQAQLGARLTEQEAAVFAYACMNEAISMTDAKSVTSRGNRDTLAVMERLVAQNLLSVIEDGVRWELAPHLQDHFWQPDQLSDQPRPELVTDQPPPEAGKLVTPKLTKLTDHQRRIIELCEVPRKQADLLVKLGLTHRTFFRRKQLEPLIKANLIRMTFPDQPHHPDQAYVVTEGGLSLLVSWRASASEPIEKHEDPNVKA
ncbi:MAG: RNA-binding domain-containing protein [Thermodesulfobacteriota bacterium]